MMINVMFSPTKYILFSDYIEQYVDMKLEKILLTALVFTFGALKRNSFLIFTFPEKVALIFPKRAFLRFSWNVNIKALRGSLWLEKLNTKLSLRSFKHCLIFYGWFEY